MLWSSPGEGLKTSTEGTFIEMSENKPTKEIFCAENWIPLVFHIKKILNLYELHTKLLTIVHLFIKNGWISSRFAVIIVTEELETPLWVKKIIFFIFFFL